MPKLCKRIIAFMLAFCLVCSLCFSAFAVTSENQATFWDAALARLAGSNDFYGFNLLDGCGIFDSLGTFISRDTVCGQSSDGYHHGTQIDSLVDGRAKVKCTECGEWFYYSAADLEDQYNNAVHDNGLDNGPIPPSSTGVSYTGHWKTDCPYLVTSANQNQVIVTANGREYKKLDSSTYFFTSIQLSSPSYYVSQFIISDNSTRVLSSCGCDYTPGPSGFPNDSWMLFYQGKYQFLVSTNYQNGYSPPSYSLNPLVVCGLDGVSDHPSANDVSKRFYSSFIDRFYVIDSETVPIGFVPTSVSINNINYNVTNYDFNLRQYRVTNENNQQITITFEDDRMIIHNETTDETTYNYYTIELDPGTVDPGDASGSGGSGCCEQCALLLRQVNSYLLQIQTLVDQINDKLGPDSDNYMEGIYNLLVEINTALDNLPTEPHKDYEAKLTTISNQLANIWGDLDTIKTSLSAVQTNTATTNQKLDTVHSDLQAVLSELQTQRGILSQILSVLRDILSHVITIDKNVDELSTEEQQQDFIHGFIGKFGFINQIYQITVQMMRDVTNDAISAQAVSDGIIPSSVLSAGHSSPENDEDFSADASIDNRAFAGPSRSGPSNPTAPEIMTAFPDVEVLGFNLSQYSALDMSWYAPYKSEVDVILSGFMYLGYLWLLFKRLPSIIRGGAMASSDYDKVQTEFYGKKGD